MVILPDSEAGEIPKAPATVAMLPSQRPDPLTGQVALVTGASRGLGKVIALTLADAGAAVGLVARSAEPLRQTMAEVNETGGTAVAVTADVSDRRAVAAAVQQVSSQLGPIDVLINNAGTTGPVGALWTADPDEWWKTLEINLRGIVTCTQLVLPSMIARRRGRIVNISTQAGAYRWPLVSAYAVSKSAEIKLTENLAVELLRTGVSVFSAHPGLLPLGLSEPAMTARPPEGTAAAQVFSWIRRQLEQGRGTEPDAAARFVLRLAAGDCDGLSGRHLSVDDDLDTLLGRIAEIKGRDMYMLRRREFTS